MPFETGPFVAAAVFASVFLFGSNVLIPAPLRSHRRKLLSLGAGITIAYVFVHLLPELEAAREALSHNEDRLALPMFGLRVYLAALIGFMAFYALGQMIAKARASGGAEAAFHEENRLQRAVHAGGFLVYVWLVGYLAVRGFEVGTTPMALYAAALGLHFLSLDFSFSREFGPWYERKVRYAFVLAPLAGWAVGILVEFSPLYTAALLGFISGGIILNAMVAELPRENEGRPLYFLLGGAIYTVLLIILS